MPFDDTTWAVSPSQRAADLEVLRKVRDSLRGNKTWCKGAFRRGERRCLVGWVDFHLRGVPTVTSWSMDLGRFCHRAMGDDVRALMRFNDDWSVSQDRVIRRVDYAIAKLEGQL